MKTLFNLILATIIATPSFAQQTQPQIDQPKTTNLYGGDSGGGGHGFLLQDDTIVIADPWLEKMEAAYQVGQHAPLPEKLVSSIKMAGFLVSHYTFDRPNGHVQRIYVSGSSSEYPFRQINSLFSKFINEEIFGKEIEYRSVSASQFPPEPNCTEPPTIGGPPNAVRKVRYGCTWGPLTWLDKDNIPKMSLRELTKAIYHERLMAHEPPTKYPYTVRRGYIADVTTGMGVLLERYHLQKKGDRTTLTDEEIRRVEAMRVALTKLGLDHDPEKVKQQLYGNSKYEYLFKNPKMVVYGNGGGFVNEELLKENKIASTAFLGVMTTILLPPRRTYYGDDQPTEIVQIEAGAQIANSSCCYAAREIKLAENARILNSNNFKLKGRLVMGANAIIENSEINGNTEEVLIGTNSQLENVKFLFAGNEANALVVKDNVSVKNMKETIWANISALKVISYIPFVQIALAPIYFTNEPVRTLEIDQSISDVRVCAASQMLAFKKTLTLNPSSLENVRKKCKRTKVEAVPNELPFLGDET